MGGICTVPYYNVYVLCYYADMLSVSTNKNSPT